jgi:hypothetical protein
MNESQQAIESSISEVDKARRALKKDKTVQVRSVDDKLLLKATALTWFNNHRKMFASSIPDNGLAKADSLFNDILTSTDKNASRNKYDVILKKLHLELVNLRSQNILSLSNTVQNNSSDIPPDFSSITSDNEMQAILIRRWNECSTCVLSNAPLSATVMMGGLLEGLLLARINQFVDKSKVFKAKSAPKDKTSGNPKTLNEWTLKDYIDVAHELKWISQTEKDLGVVLRDYRNYIHPQKERSHGIIIESKDAKLLWELSKSISRQLLATP